METPVVHGALGLRPKKFQTIVLVPRAPIRVPSQRPLAPSVASVANDQDDNEMILGLCTDLLAFALQLRKTFNDDSVRQSCIYIKKGNSEFWECRQYRIRTTEEYYGK